MKVYGKLWRWLQVLDDQEKKHAPVDPEEDWDRQFCVALQKKTYIKYALSVLENGTEEEKRELMKGMEKLEKGT